MAKGYFLYNRNTFASVLHNQHPSITIAKIRNIQLYVLSVFFVLLKAQNSVVCGSNHTACGFILQTSSIANYSHPPTNPAWATNHPKCRHKHISCARGFPEIGRERIKLCEFQTRAISICKDWYVYGCHTRAWHITAANIERIWLFIQIATLST